MVVLLQQVKDTWQMLPLPKHCNRQHRLRLFGNPKSSFPLPPQWNEVRSLWIMKGKKQVNGLSSVLVVVLWQWESDGASSINTPDVYEMTKMDWDSAAVRTHRKELLGICQGVRRKWYWDYLQEVVETMQAAVKRGLEQEVGLAWPVELAPKSLYLLYTPVDTNSRCSHVDWFSLMHWLWGEMHQEVSLSLHRLGSCGSSGRTLSSGKKPWLQRHTHIARSCHSRIGWEYREDQCFYIGSQLMPGGSGCGMLHGWLLLNNCLEEVRHK